MEGADTMSYTHLSFSACPALIGGWWLTCSSEYTSSKLWEWAAAAPKGTLQGLQCVSMQDAEEATPALQGT